MNSASVGGDRLDFYRDAKRFLREARDHLAAEPVVSTVVTTMADRSVARRTVGVEPPEPHWWVVVRDGAGEVVGAGMRTAPFEPHPPFLLPMPDEAAVALARALYERGEEVLAVNGALPATRLFADELARLGGGTVTVAAHTRLHEITEVIPPAPAPGRLVVATEDDLDVVIAWCEAFMGDADEQAGRERGVSAHPAADRDETLRRIRGGRYWFWVTEDGERVHLTGASPPSYGVARIGPVYTPPAQRGRGWASNAVAEVSRLILAEGARACLYTDQANPTSNKIYAAIGYRPVVDMVNVTIDPPRPDR